MEATDSLVKEICLLCRADTPETRTGGAKVAEGVLEALSALEDSFRFVTLSNLSSVDASPLPSEVGRYIGSTYRSYELGYAKPSPEAFMAMCLAEGVSAHKVIHIGDSWSCDIQGAASVGMSAIWVSRENGAESQPTMLDEKTIMVKSMKDIPLAVAMIAHEE